MNKLFWDKIETFKQWSEKKPSFWSMGAPPIYKFLWSRKVPIMPPYYQSKLKFLLFQGVSFSVPFLITLIPIVILKDPPLIKYLIFPLVLVMSIVLFGGCMLLAREYELNKLPIPKWDDL